MMPAKTCQALRCHKLGHTDRLALRFGTGEKHGSLSAATAEEGLCWPAFQHLFLHLLSQQPEPLLPPFPTLRAAWLSLPAALSASAPIPPAALPARAYKAKLRVSAFRSAFSLASRFASNSCSPWCTPLSCAQGPPRKLRVASKGCNHVTR